MKRLELLLALALTIGGCYHGVPGPSATNDVTQPPFPIKSSPCAGNIDPNCWPFDAKGQKPQKFGLLTTVSPARAQAGVLCQVSNSAATALTAFGGQCVAPGPGLSIYITDISASASVISAAVADQFLELKYGTGGTCGTGTGLAWSSYHIAWSSVNMDMTTPIKIPANNELCWMDAIAGSKTFVVTGFIAP